MGAKLKRTEVELVGFIPGYRLTYKPIGGGRIVRVDADKLTGWTLRNIITAEPGDKFELVELV